jgi:hypothetical protein
MTEEDFKRKAEETLPPQFIAACSAEFLGRYENTFSCVLANARRFKTPVPYKHPSGAVIYSFL